MTKKIHSRQGLTIAAAVLVVAGLVYAFWPQPTLVDMDTVMRGSMMQTVDEEARTRVRDVFTVSAPAAGRMARVTVEPGDRVEEGQTVLARMLPATPPVLDLRERKRAASAVQAAEAALQAARAQRESAEADKNLADVRIERAHKQLDLGTISEAELQQATREAAAATASLRNAVADIAIRDAELTSAKAAFLDGEDTGATAAYEIKAPISGRVLRVLQESEVVLAAGTPILEIGNVESNLEVVVELLSSNAGQVGKGDRVIVDNWGGDGTLSGEVQRIDSLAFTKLSALGVEEQRVNTIVRLTNPAAGGGSLGHGYRADVRIVIWEKDDATIAPASALFRLDDDWAVFVVEDGEARLRRVTVERNNGTQASIADGLQPDEQVILYPSSDLQDGMSVARREAGG